MGSHWFEWGNADVHYHKSGWGDPLLLIHDLYGGASGEEFDRNVKFLNSQFTVYRLDLIGFGFSQSRAIRFRAADYADLIDGFIEQVIGSAAHVTAVGRSCGFVAAAAAGNPEHFGNLAFISPEICSPALVCASWFRTLLRETFWLALISPPLRTMFRSVMSGAWELGEFLRRTVHDPRCIDSSKLERLETLAREPGTLGAYASLEAGLLCAPIQPFLPGINSPTLFITGAESTDQQRKGIDLLSSMTGFASIARISGARLWPHYEQPRATNPLLADFLNAGNLVEPAARQTIAA